MPGIMTCGKFASQQKVRVVNDWFPMEAKKLTATILTFQNNNGKMFARVQWSKLEYADEFGVLFPLDELRRI
jgi:hypothetical protein